MSADTLKDELVAMGLFLSEQDAIDGWAAAFRKYFEDATAGIIPVVADALDAPEGAMKNAMVGLSVTAPDAIQSGIVAFWDEMKPNPGVYFLTATAIAEPPPPALTTLNATLATTFANNRATAASAEDAYDAIASDIHEANINGGTATFPIPTGTQPIL